jgi:uncharacterized RDD family membrane protein YckC
MNLATRESRSIAAIINMVTGGLPVIIPNLIYSSNFDFMWSRCTPLLSVIGIVLCIMQLLFVHKMQGSIGFCFMGLRVVNLDGSSISLRKMLLRAIPYLVYFIMSILVPRYDTYNNNVPIAIGVITSLTYMVTITFIVISSLRVVFYGKDSLIDHITKTIVVKC